MQNLVDKVPEMPLAGCWVEPVPSRICNVYLTDGQNSRHVTALLEEAEQHVGWQQTHEVDTDKPFSSLSHEHHHMKSQKYHWST